MAASEDLLKYIVPKGYVAVDGTSLTVVDVVRGGGAAGASASTTPIELQAGEAGWFSFMLVAHTQKCIVMPGKPLGAPINIEVDVMAKYVEQSLAARATAGPATRAESTLDSALPWVALSTAVVALGVAVMALRAAGGVGGKR